MLAVAAVAAVALGGTAIAIGQDGTTAIERTDPRSATNDLPQSCAEGGPGSRTTEIATAKLIIEYNATDNDIGVHGAFDDHGWDALCLFDPAGNPVLVVGPQGQLRDLTMAGIFFESREPPASEFSFADLAAAFPEGSYTLRGTLFDGTLLVGSATFTHDVPEPPTITSPEIADDPRGTKKHPEAIEDLVVGWDPVTHTLAGEPVEISGYQVIITKERHDDPHGFSRPVYDVHVPPTLTGLSVPAEFFEADTVYELEVLALETSGNQTISVGFFRTA